MADDRSRSLDVLLRCAALGVSACLRTSLGESLPKLGVALAEDAAATRLARWAA